MPALCNTIEGARYRDMLARSGQARSDRVMVMSALDIISVALAPIAKAVLNLDTCLNNQGTICDTCAVMCPPHVKAIKMINRKPLLDVDLCTGCGMCAYYCESEPGSITIVALEE